VRDGGTLALRALCLNYIKEQERIISHPAEKKWKSVTVQKGWTTRWW